MHSYFIKGIELYTREIQDLPEKFVCARKPVFGTFKGHPKRLDIRGVFRPIGVIPLPVFITNLRIKSRLTFSFSSGDFMGHMSFVDAKILGYMEAVFINPKTKQKFAYHCVTGPRKRLIPHSLEKASASTWKKSRHARISWDASAGKFAASFDLKGNGIKPHAAGTITADFVPEKIQELTSVRPNPTSRRCSATYNAVLETKSDFTFEFKDGQKSQVSQEPGIGFFDMSRTYMRFRSHGKSVIGMSRIKDKIIAFRLCEESHDAYNPDQYNFNVLFHDGRITPLPPVAITHSRGYENDWVIQDTENMVDLTFTPSASILKRISAVIARTEYRTLAGTFEGTLMDADGEKISFKSLPGIAENYLIRL